MLLSKMCDRESLQLQQDPVGPEEQETMSDLHTGNNGSKPTPEEGLDAGEAGSTSPPAESLDYGEKIQESPEDPEGEQAGLSQPPGQPSNDLKPPLVSIRKGTDLACTQTKTVQSSICRVLVWMQAFYSNQAVARLTQ